MREPARGGPVPAAGPRVRADRRVAAGQALRFAPLPLPDSKQLRLKRYYPDAVYKPATDQVCVPRPTTRRIGGEPLRDQALLQWCAQLLTRRARRCRPGCAAAPAEAARGASGAVCERARTCSRAPRSPGGRACVAAVCRERVVAMQRARRLAAVAVAASVAVAGSPVPCGPGVAAYVGRRDQRGPASADARRVNPRRRPPRPQAGRRRSAGSRRGASTLVSLGRAERGRRAAQTDLPGQTGTRAGYARQLGAPGGHRVRAAATPRSTTCLHAAPAGRAGRGPADATTCASLRRGSTAGGEARPARPLEQFTTGTAADRPAGAGRRRRPR